VWLLCGYSHNRNTADVKRNDKCDNNRNTAEVKRNDKCDNNRNTADVKCLNKSGTGNNRDNWNNLKTFQKIPEQHTWKARHQGTTESFGKFQRKSKKTFIMANSIH
jgi:hypothetical protein